jgi:hypothetical protein
LEVWNRRDWRTKYILGKIVGKKKFLTGRFWDSFFCQSYWELALSLFVCLLNKEWFLNIYSGPHCDILAAQNTRISLRSVLTLDPILCSLTHNQPHGHTWP